jgi:hypothetical protein
VRHFVLVLLAACSSGKAEPAQPATPVERASDPWATPATAPDQPAPAAGNINKLVIGGDNKKPQMGLFALSRDDAKRVDAAMEKGLEPAYRLAEKLSVKAWTGDRNFCEDAVRQTIGYFGIDGMLSAKDLRGWRTAKLADVRKEHGAAINDLFYKMIGEHDKAACDKTLTIYVEGLQLAAKEQLQLRNFGY